MRKGKLEVLSPAGDITRLKAAVDFGADAVYFAGKEFGMRAAPDNFTAEQLKEGIDYAHERGVSAHITLNTLPRNNEVARLPEFIETAASFGVDAFIVCDIGVIGMVKKYAPKAQLHISVQSGVVNYESARFFYENGADRVVVARELSLDEIAQIRAKTPKKLELEAFAHGAVCMSVSGRCLLSNYLTGRDANRGACAQPCRWKYHLVEETRPGQYMQISQDESGSYILNAKDMCMIEYIPQMYKAGITSLKLEGRAKTEYYTAAVTNAYRRAVDMFTKDGDNYRLPPELFEEVNKISHREYSTGFYFDTPGQVYETGGYIRDYELVGIVTDYSDGIVTLAQRNRFYAGTLDILDAKKGSVIVDVPQLYDEDMQPIDCANHSCQTVKFHCEPVGVGSFVRVKTKKE